MQTDSWLERIYCKKFKEIKKSMNPNHSISLPFGLSLLHKVPRVSKCPSALSAQVSKCPSALQVPEWPPNFRVPRCSPSALWVFSRCLSAQVSWMFECPLSVFKSMFQAWMSNQIWLEQSSKHKIMFHLKRWNVKRKKW